VAIDLTLVDVANAFPVGQPPVLSAEEQTHFERTDTKRVLAHLSGKSWSQVADPAIFQQIEPDVLHWFGALPVEWFAYYLPALMSVAITSGEPWVENLRALLVQALGQSLRKSAHNKRLRAYVETNLSQPQQKVVTLFLLCVKHGKFRHIS
jgi:hypothetical protein